VVVENEVAKEAALSGDEPLGARPVLDRLRIIFGEKYVLAALSLFGQLRTDAAPRGGSPLASAH
jgi:hypothetical protein